MLFAPKPRFEGLPRSGFDVFGIEDHEARRRAIIEVFHPQLERLGEDLLDCLNAQGSPELHAHLPRLDWPRGYQAFCTWLALSRKAQGYQDGPQLNVGVHRDSVGLRLGWDCAADAFGRFEFLCRHGELGRELCRQSAELDLRFRVFAAAPWPRGSRQVFESPDDLQGSFDEVRLHGVWWELGRVHPVPADLEHVGSPALGRETAALFLSLLPAYDRMAGDP